MKAIERLALAFSLVVLSNYSTTASVVVKPISAATQVKCAKQNYNHYAYKEVDRNLLATVGNGQKLHQDAAKAFKQMQQAAKKDGITLTPISGYRSVQQQHYLFHEVAKQRGQNLKQRARISAPPGYSQHHTGLAVDINSLNQSFANTKTFTWLQNNAHKYEFKLSFPPNNHQGIAFEPWHWTWHGSSEAKQALHANCLSSLMP